MAEPEIGSVEKFSPTKSFVKPNEDKKFRMGDVQGYFITYDTLHTTLIQNIDKFRESGILSDCMLEAEGKYLKAHKVILSASSRYFNNVFIKYHKDTIFRLKDVSFEVLRAMVDFIYKGEVLIVPDQLQNFLKAAEFFEIRGLFESASCQPQYSFTDSKEQDASRKAPNFVDDLSKGELISSASVSESILSIRNNNLRKRKIYERRNIDCDSIDSTVQKQVVLTLENIIQRNSECLDIPKYQVDDCTLDHDLTQKENVLKDLSDRNGLQISVSQKRKKRKIGGFDSIDVAHQEQQYLQTPAADTKSRDDPAYIVSNLESFNEFTEVDKDILQLIFEDSDTSESVIKSKSLSLDNHHTKAISKKFVSDTTVLKTSISSNTGSPKKQNRYICSRCGNTYNSIHALNSHSNKICRTEKQFQCDICQRKMKFKENLAAHIKTHYQESKIFSCSQCPNTYKRLDSFSRHIMYECLKAPQFQCNICKKKVKRKDSIILHMRTHDLERKQYSCTQCGDVYKCNKQLSKHLKYECGKKISCPQCGNTYKLIDSLNRHLRHECGKEPQFQCDHCPKKVKLKSTLVGHMKVHFGEENKRGKVRKNQKSNIPFLE